MKMPILELQSNEQEGPVNRSVEVGKFKYRSQGRELSNC